MNTAFVPTSQGYGLETGPEAFGDLEDSSDALGNPEELRSRMRSKGYLLMRGMLDRESVLGVRREIVSRLAASGQLAEGTDPMDAVAGAVSGAFQPGLAQDNPGLEEVLYSGPMMEFFEALLGGDVLHFDYTWLRAVPPGPGTPSHCDIVYMGRGTRDLFTAWTPLGDIDFSIGGLMVLEGSHLQADRLRNYLSRDVDAYCVNRPGAREIESGENPRPWSGTLSKNPVSLREKLGGRWLTAEYRAGDVLVFGMDTVHASLDNRSDRVRLSSDSRYQLASEVADERWIGPNPIGHGLAGKRGRIC